MALHVRREWERERQRERGRERERWRKRSGFWDGRWLCCDGNSYVSEINDKYQFTYKHSCGIFTFFITKFFKKYFIVHSHDYRIYWFSDQRVRLRSQRDHEQINTKSRVEFFFQDVSKFYSIVWMLAIGFLLRMYQIANSVLNEDAFKQVHMKWKTWRYESFFSVVNHTLNS